MIDIAPHCRDLTSLPVCRARQSSVHAGPFGPPRVPVRHRCGFVESPSLCAVPATQMQKGVPPEWNAFARSVFTCCRNPHTRLAGPPRWPPPADPRPGGPANSLRSAPNHSSTQNRHPHGPRAARNDGFAGFDDMVAPRAQGVNANRPKKGQPQMNADGHRWPRRRASAGGRGSAGGKSPEATKAAALRAIRRVGFRPTAVHVELTGARRGAPLRAWSPGGLLQGGLPHVFLRHRGGDHIPDLTRRRALAC
jgi:hypothetical protein